MGIFCEACLKYLKKKRLFSLNDYSTKIHVSPKVSIYNRKGFFFSSILFKHTFNNLENIVILRIKDVGYHKLTSLSPLKKITSWVFITQKLKLILNYQIDN